VKNEVVVAAVKTATFNPIARGENSVKLWTVVWLVGSRDSGLINKQMRFSMKYEVVFTIKRSAVVVREVVEADSIEHAEQVIKQQVAAMNYKINNISSIVRVE
jgi:hypothetical protein